MYRKRRFPIHIADLSSARQASLYKQKKIILSGWRASNWLATLVYLLKGSGGVEELRSEGVEESRSGEADFSEGLIRSCASFQSH